MKTPDILSRPDVKELLKRIRMIQELRMRTTKCVAAILIAAGCGFGAWKTRTDSSWEPAIFGAGAILAALYTGANGLPLLGDKKLIRNLSANIKGLDKTPDSIRRLCEIRKLIDLIPMNAIDSGDIIKRFWSQIIDSTGWIHLSHANGLSGKGTQPMGAQLPQLFITLIKSVFGGFFHSGAYVEGQPYLIMKAKPTEWEIYTELLGQQKGYFDSFNGHKVAFFIYKQVSEPDGKQKQVYDGYVEKKGDRITFIPLQGAPQDLTETHSKQRGENPDNTESEIINSLLNKGYQGCFGVLSEDNTPCRVLYINICGKTIIRGRTVDGTNQDTQFDDEVMTKVHDALRPRTVPFHPAGWNPEHSEISYVTVGHLMALMMIRAYGGSDQGVPENVMAAWRKLASNKPN